MTVVLWCYSFLTSTSQIPCVIAGSLWSFASYGGAWSEDGVCPNDARTQEASQSNVCLK